MTPEPTDWLRSVMDRYQRPLAAYARRLLGSDDAARDAAQETFLRLVSKSPGELNGSLVPWLYTVCRLRFVELVKRAKSIAEK